MGLTVALDDSGTAEGQMFWDDGQSIGERELSIVSIRHSEKPHPRSSGHN